MKLVAVSRVRNEVDIIEPFVRHHCEYFTKLIVLDDGSSDGTLELLRSLQASGLPLVVLSEQALTYVQSRYMTLLLRLAAHQFGADWVVPLDADEFIEPQDNMTLAEALAGRPPEPLSLAWSNFAWSPESSEARELNPVLRLRLRLPPRLDNIKVIVPAQLVDESVQLAQGNHALVRDGRAIPAAPLDTVRLCHFPIRDPLQYAGKIAIGYLKYSAMEGWNRDAGFQYVEPFRSLLAGGFSQLEKRMAADSRRYSLEKDTFHDENAEPQDLPLRYKGGAITFTPARQTVLSNVLHFAEDLAKELAAASSRRKEAANTIELLKAEQAIVIQRSRQLAEDTVILEKRLSKMEMELLAARETIFLQSEQLSSSPFRSLERVRHYLSLEWLSRRRS